MSNATAFGTLLWTHLKQWLGAKGFVLVVVAALFPLALTGAWAATHQADVATTELKWTPSGDLKEGDVLNLTSVVENVGPVPAENFSASLTVGVMTQSGFRAMQPTSVDIESLAPGEKREIHMEWPAAGGSFYVIGLADPDDNLLEVEEFNNHRTAPLFVPFSEPDPETAPESPGNLTGSEDAGSATDLEVSSIETTPRDLTAGENVTLSATVTNAGDTDVTDATVTLEVGFGAPGEFSPIATTTESVSVPAGESATVPLEWATMQGAFWARAYVSAPDDVHDPDGANNHATQGLAVQPERGDAQPEPPENVTIKEFYLLILQFLYIPILVPLIALFYAGGVVTDERNRGTLPWLLTRPLGRWAIPVSRYASGFLVGAIAVAVGIFATYLMLFQLPGGQDYRFLTHPLLVTLIALFVYGAVFVLLGVLTDRPYLVGVAFILGWEVVARMFLPWVQNLTIRHHVLTFLEGFIRIEQGEWLPAEGSAYRGLLTILAIGAGFIVASAFAMQRREFQG